MEKLISIIFFLNFFTKEQFDVSLNKLIHLTEKNNLEILFVIDPCTPKEFVDEINHQRDNDGFVGFHKIRLVVASQELSDSRALEQALVFASGDYVIFLTNNLSINPDFSFAWIQDNVNIPNPDIIAIHNEKDNGELFHDYVEKNYLPVANELNEKLIFFFMLNNTFLNIYSRKFLIDSNVFKEMKDHFYPFFFKLQLLSKIKKWVCLKTNILSVDYSIVINDKTVYDTYFQMIHLMNNQNLKKIFLTKEAHFYETVEILIVYVLLIRLVDMLIKIPLDNGKQIDLFIKLAYNFVTKYFPGYAKNTYLKADDNLSQYLLKFKPERKYIDKNFPNIVKTNV